MTDITESTAQNGSAPPTIVDKASAYRSTQEASELIRTDAGDIQASTVSMEQSGAESITAERVSMTRSGAKQLTAKSAQLERSGVMMLEADSAVLHNSSAMTVTTKSARIVKSAIVFFKSDTTTVEGELKSLIHIGSACDNVKPVFSGQGALRFGLGLGIALVVGRRLLGMLGRAS